MTKVGDTGVELLSRSLSGKRVAYGVCGGIGSVESVKIIREIRRHGAEVVPFATPSALRFITPLSLEWAANHPLAGDGPDTAYLRDFDVVVVAPTTLDTLIKVSLGICENALLLLVASQIGGKRPVLLYPTMNEKMAAHPQYVEAKRVLKSWNVGVMEPGIVEERLKMPDPASVAAQLRELVGNG